MNFRDATGQERSYEDQDGTDYIRDNGEFAISCAGHYTATELRAKLAQLEEANEHFEPKPAPKPAPAYRLEFFSGAESPDNETGEHGYDGSMSRATFDPADLAAHVRHMDCICGPVVVVVTSPEGYKSAHLLTRESDA